MAHQLQLRAATAAAANDTMPVERKKELIDNFLLVETYRTSAEVPSGDANNEQQQQQPSCAVCLDPFQEGDLVARAQNDACKHLYHKDCIAEWLLQNMECPLCKRNFLSLSAEDETERTAEEEEDEDMEQPSSYISTTASI